MATEDQIDLSQPRYDQSTFTGRAKHFFIVTNPLNLFCSGKELDGAKELLTAYRNRCEPVGTTPDQLWKAKSIYDSAFHPDTGEKMFMLGRMSAQVPCNMSITGCMMAFRTGTPTIVFWQWLNQSFNAVVNYTNRAGDSKISTKQLGISYLLATGAATGTALGLNRVVTRLPEIFGRYVPFAAVAAANCINIPFMRSKELIDGVPVDTESGERLGQSPNAAKKGIAQVVFSRIVMATPGMAIPPIIMQRLEKGAFLKKYPKMNGPMTVGIVGFMLVFATPLCCAIFPQRSSIRVSSLEKALQDEIRAKYPTLETVYFNKGL